VFICGMVRRSVYWHLKTRLESAPITADLTTTVVYSYKLLINDVKPVRSLDLGTIMTGAIAKNIDLTLISAYIHANTS